MIDWSVFWSDYFHAVLNASPFFITAIVVVAILSNQLARRANTIAAAGVRAANEANRLTRDALVSNLMPWLQVEALAVGTGKGDESAGSTELMVDMEVSNFGKAPAFIVGGGLSIDGVAELNDPSDVAPADVKTVVMPGEKTPIQVRVPLRSSDAMQRNAVVTAINFGDCEVTVVLKYEDVLSRIHSVHVAERRSSPTSPWVLKRYETRQEDVVKPIVERMHPPPIAPIPKRRLWRRRIRCHPTAAPA